MAAPSMKERQACWGARDEYWKCLDENTEDASRCKKLRSSFESSCPQQWVVTTHRADLPVLCGCFPLAIYFTFGSVYVSMPLSRFVTAHPSPSPDNAF
nr:cytochrome c oxidase assembly factor 6 homolog isoform X2 [Globicephala melas]